jgi:RNA-directed DNA polymerase
MDAGGRAMQEQLPSSDEISVMERAKGLNHSVGLIETTGNGRNSVNRTKLYNIPKQLIYDAYQRVKANKGSSGVDGQSLQSFDQNLSNNLYKLWNRLSSGSYFPQAVRRVDIPKADGGIRPLGIPTVADRIAQMAVKMQIEAELERHFHPDSYGYRPNKSAHQALEQVKERCWHRAWVLDMDIKDSLMPDHNLLLRAVDKHTGCTSNDGWRHPCNIRTGVQNRGRRERHKVGLSARC